MSETAYRLTVGKNNCIIFSDGQLVDPGETFGLNCILIESGKHKILIDNGCGRMFQGTAGHLLNNMLAEGIKPGDIDIIVFDHGHIDHVCGTFDEKGKPVFPNARYIISKKEWEYIEARPTANETQNNFFKPARKYLIPLKDRFSLVGDNYEIIPGVRFVPASGHTPGNSMVSINSNGKSLLCIGDVIHSPRELVRPDYCAAFDVIPEEAIRTRDKIIKKVVEDGTFIFATHFTFPGLGYFRENQGVLSWEPAS